MVAINSNAAKFDKEDSIIEMRSHAAKNKYNFPYVQDKNSKLAKLFGATKTPHIYLFDSNDILVYKGAIDDIGKGMKFFSASFADATNYVATQLSDVKENKKGITGKQTFKK